MNHMSLNHSKSITTSKKEITDLFKSWLLLGIAFGIALNGLTLNMNFLFAIIISLITVGVGFIAHELSHKIVAQRYGCIAEFRSDDKMLVLALLVSLVGFIFAAPGAVLIRGHLSKKQNGVVSAAGPIASLIIALLFLSISFQNNGFAATIAFYGFTINSWLALFNLIPVSIFDGKKVYDWSKPIYFTLAIIALLFVLVPQIVL